VVTSKAGVPLGNICIGAYTPNEAGYLFGVFGDSYNGQTGHGAYQIINLAPGQYQLVFFSCGSGPGWASQWYRTAPDLASAGLLDVPAATTLTGVNAAMTRGGAISGTVRAPAGQQFSFTCIIATSLSSGASESTEADSFPAGLPVRYAIGGLAPGLYRVEFYDCGGNSAATQWYSDKAGPAAANPVTVRARHVTAHIDAVLARPSPSAGAGSISGRVTSRATGKPVAGICVAAFSQAVYQSARSDAHGDYTITHLASGSYRLYFSGCHGYRYAAEVLPAKVRVHAPHAVRGVNIAVAQAGSISGAVAAGSPTTTPRPGVCVTVFPMTVSALPGYAVTGRGGTYAIRGLAPGRYQVYFDPVGCTYGAMPFAPQWYSGQASRSTATPVTVTAGGKTAGINGTLARDGTITGAVTGPAPAFAPLTGICLQATPAHPLARAGRPVYTVSQSGRYALTELPPGRYLVSFTSGCGAGGYAAQWWQDATSRAAATAVTVSPGSVTKGIDAAMHS
jgi:hypothetical protein